METADQALVHALHRDHGQALWSHCLRLTSHDRGRAEDLVQETLLRAWRHASSLDERGEAQRPGSVRGWLFTTARNLAIDEWRRGRSRAEVVLAEVPEGDGEPDRTEEVLQSWLVAEALSRLTPEHRAVVVETYYRGASVAEAAERLGIPQGTVKSRCHYGLRALRLALQELGVAS